MSIIESDPSTSDATAGTRLGSKRPVSVKTAVTSGERISL
jgi:hypothetical protein